MPEKKEVNRRSLIKGLIGVGALGALDSVFTAEPTDAAQVGPNDTIRVTKIETFVLKNSWVFVKISTDAGITGWGEMLKDDAKACAAGALEVGDYLIGQDPCRVVHHWQAIHRGAFYRGGPIKTAITSGIDQALWDIKGKVYGVSTDATSSGCPRPITFRYATKTSAGNRCELFGRRSISADWCGCGVTRSTSTEFHQAPSFFRELATIQPSAIDKIS